MSRSYKHRPFMSICGGGSAKRDKVLAHRGERRAVQQALHKARREQDFEDFVYPLRRECCHNNTYDWNRDGKQHYCGLRARDWHDHLKALDPETHCQYPWMYDFYKEHDGEWPPTWYTEMMRK